MRAVIQRYIWMVIISLCFMVVLTFLGRGSFLHSLIVFSIVAYIAIPSIIICVLAKLIAKFWRPMLMRKIQLIGFWLVGISLFQLLSLATGDILNDQDIKKAQQFCESLMPLLDSYKQEAGDYPESIAKIIPEDCKIPRILKSGDYYYKGDSSFTFSFDNPQAFLFGGYEYDSIDKKWKEWD